MVLNLEGKTIKKIEERSLIGEPWQATEEVIITFTDGTELLISSTSTIFLERE